MNKYFYFSSLFVIISLKALSQSGDSIAKPVPIEVKNWMKSKFLLREGFWEGNKREQIIGQIGEAEFEKVKEFSDYKKIPSAMLLFDFERGVKRDTSEYIQQLSLLKVFKIASYDHWGNDKYWGKYIIIRVPFIENMNWNPKAKWDTVYFIIPEEFTVPIASKNSF